MDLVSPIITPIIQSLLVPVNKHLSFLVSSSIYVRDMHVRITELDGTARDVYTKQVLNQANDLVVPHHVPNWLEEVETIMELSKRIPAGGVGCFNIKTRYKIGKESYDTLKVIDRLMKEKAEMAWTNERIPLAMVTSPRDSAVDDVNHNKNKNNIYSRDLIFIDALKFLDPNNINTQKVALCGMAGIGKTTMMEQLKQAAKDRRMFDWIVKVDVGQNPNPVGVQQTIAEYIGVALSETNKDIRAERLQKRFEAMSKEGKKKILVILDDVWEEFSFKDIGLSSSLPNGIKLLLTSREESVCTRMGVEATSIIKMVVLEEREAKKLFWGIVGVADGGDIEPDLHDIGEDIVKRCGGLPIAITTIASTLRDIKEKDEWKDALYRIQNKGFKVLINIFEFSYKNLKENDLKSIFLVCGLFPEDYNIVIEDLVIYGWGLNFLRDLHKIAIARSRVNTCVNKLIRSNLLTKSDLEGCVKMHDLVRDFVLSRLSDVKQASIVNHDITISQQLKEDESYERILLKCRGMSEFPIDFKYPNLTLLKLMDGNKRLRFPKDFYKRMEKLEVVAYDNMNLHVFPQYSTKLRALSLRSCSLMGDISFLGDLINLEVLSLVNCGIYKLPSNIGKLKMLKLLDLTGCAHLCIDEGVFKNLEKLEELYMRVSYNGIRFTDANCEELKMLSRKLSALEVEFFKNNIAKPRYVSFEQLDRFRISVGCSLRMVDNLHSFKNTLKLMTSCEEILECGINELFRKTEILYLERNDMKHLQDISIHLPQHSFCNLKILNVSNCSNLTCLFTVHVVKGLRLLEILEITWCRSLKEIWSCEITSNEEEVNTITMLKKIKVESCHNIVNLFPTNPMRLLSHLEELSINHCDSIEALFNVDLGKIEQHGSSSSLRIIQVEYLKNLREVWKIEDVENNNSGLVIGGFQSVESLHIRNCVRFRNIVTPTTTKFDMTTLKEINISNQLREKEINEMLKEEGSKVDDNMPIVRFMSSLTHDNFHHIRNIEFYKFPRVEVVFEIDSPSNRDELVTTQQPLLLHPYLEHLKLENMDMLSHVWKCSNWNEFFVVHKHQPQSSFQNLTTIKLGSCDNIKYLFSPVMAKLLSNLKEVRIGHCRAIEEVVSKRDDADEDEELMPSSTDTNITLFPHLDILNLYSLYKLKHIGGAIPKDTTNSSQVGVASWSLCQYSTEIHIRFCDALTSVIPYYATERMQKLQVLSIECCRSLMEVFETTEININNISTLGTPRQNILLRRLPNLKILNINGCHCLENIFTFSTLESLTKLEKLTITNCKSMKVIVREEDGEQTTTSSKDVIFLHLKSVKLDDLPNLAGFFLGMNIDFHWPLLDDVMIKNCPQMMVFTYGRSTTPRLKYIHTELGKHALECGLNSHLTVPSSSLGSINLQGTISEERPWSFNSLFECDLYYNIYDHKTIFPFNKLQQLQKLETIKIKSCDRVKEVFEVALEVTNNESQTVVKFHKLREMQLSELRRLNYIWKSNQWTILEFPNLTRLYIINCESLEHVFTCSMVGCVMQLQELHIQDCKNMKVIVKGEEDCDAKVSEIKFPHLKSLKLDSKNLEGFCLGKEDFTFPCLDTLVVKGRPRMLFTKGRSIAPKLTTVETSFGSFNGGEDINSFIMTEKEWTPSTSLDTLSSHPPTSERRHLPFQNLIKCHLNFYYEHTKIFASNELQQLQKLEKIHAEKCSCLEEVFEVAAEVINDDSETLVKFPKLRELELEYLRRLEHIWKSNQGRILEFPNLTRLYIYKCDKLEHVFTCSMLGCVKQLQELHIVWCENMTVVVMGEEEKDCDAKVNEIMFPCLKSLKLSSLSSLKGFCLGNEDFTFPSLDTLQIKKCYGITVFTHGRSITPNLTIVDTRNGLFAIGEDINSFIISRNQLGNGYI